MENAQASIFGNVSLYLQRQGMISLNIAYQKHQLLKKMFAGSDNWWWVVWVIMCDDSHRRWSGCARI